MNEFAHGKGETQFMNLAFNLNPIIALTVPYSILGSGLVLVPTEDLQQAIVSLFFRSSTGKASTGGFDDLNDDNLTSPARPGDCEFTRLTISLIGELS
jgi:porin